MKVRGVHKSLGEIFFTESCWYMQRKNPDSQSIFVEHDDDIKEVTTHFCSFFDSEGNKSKLIDVIKGRVK
jgi:uncharacterized sporulation protein YeaH/YhbH (DUF444 family)